jgi:hypothetical protein
MTTDANTSPDRLSGVSDTAGEDAGIQPESEEPEMSRPRRLGSFVAGSRVDRVRELQSAGSDLPTVTRSGEAMSVDVITERMVIEMSRHFRRDTSNGANSVPRTT